MGKLGLATLAIVTALMSGGCTPEGRARQAPPSPGCQKPAPTSAKGFQELFDSLEGHWSGADGAVSVETGDGRTLWLFSDTIVGNHAGRGYAPGARIVHNSMLVQTKGCLEQVGGGREVIPVEADGTFFWPQAAVKRDTQVWVFGARVRATGTGPFDFKPVGSAIAVLSIEGTPKFERLARTPSWDAKASDVIWGAGVLEDEGVLYVYGTRRDMEPLHFGKELYVSKLEDGRQSFYDGKGWSTRASDARALLGAVGGVSQALSVLKVNGRVKLVSKVDDYLGRQVAVWDAPAPTGKFGRPSTLFEAASQPTGTLTYLPMAHPQFRLASGRMLVSVSRNDAKLEKVLGNHQLYRPQFHEVSLH